MAFSPSYLTLNAVKIWLYGKVKFGTDPYTSITDDFLGTLISFAESEVEHRFNKLYKIPFVSRGTGGTYDALPQTTRSYLEELMTMRAVMLVLAIDFGQKGTVIAENYLKQIEGIYYPKLNSNFKRDETGRFSLPPLPGLALNYEMYTGRTIMPVPQVVDQFVNAGDSLVYAVQQITKPWMSWWQFFPYGQNTGVNNTAVQ